jgi:hypothetical protein
MGRLRMIPAISAFGPASKSHLMPFFQTGELPVGARQTAPEAPCRWGHIMQCTPTVKLKPWAGIPGHWRITVAMGSLGN